MHAQESTTSNSFAIGFQLSEYQNDFDEVDRINRSSDVELQNQVEPEVNIPVRPKIYIGMGGGFPSTGGVSANFLLKNNMGGSLQFRHFQTKDYDRLNTYSLCFTKVFTLENTKLIRFGVECGPSWVTYLEAHDVHFVWGFEGADYYTTSNTFGLTARVKVEFPLSQGAGLEIAIPININKYKSVVGIEIYLTLGRVRDRIKPKK